MHLLSNKLKDGPRFFFLHFCKQRKERKAIPGGPWAETGHGWPPFKALHCGANPQETGPHNPARLAHRALGIAENQVSPPLGAHVCADRSRWLGTEVHERMRALCVEVRGGSWVQEDFGA